MRRLRQIRGVQIKAHENLYAKMEEIRKMYMKKCGIKLSQIQLTNLISQRIRPIKYIDIMGGDNVKKKR